MNRGYTLLELIVSVGIFSVIMLAIAAAYLSLIAIDRESRAINDSVTNLSFAVDSMGREIRTGKDYKCNKTGSNCTNGGDSLRFTDSEGRQVDYELQNGQLKTTIAGSAAYSTDPRITISKLTFYVRGVGVGDGVQPQVTVTMHGSIPVGPTRISSTTVEVSATQRLLEL
jgi:prepilin-type N-terminal cleavage/methylation domain-containing protein